MAETGLEHGGYERRERKNLESLRHALEVGECGVLKAWLERFGPRLSTSSRPHVVAEYLEICERASRAFEIEKVHGRGSFLNLDHPMVAKDIEWVRNGGKESFPLDRIEAAKRYRALATCRDR